MTQLYCSSPKMTVQVGVDEDGIIREAAPVARRFIGQPFINLWRWAKFDKVESLDGGDLTVELKPWKWNRQAATISAAWSEAGGMEKKT